MLLKRTSKARGKTPGFCGVPVMVCVFPEDVTPYANSKADKRIRESLETHDSSLRGKRIEKIITTVRQNADHPTILSLKHILYQRQANMVEKSFLSGIFLKHMLKRALCLQDKMAMSLV